MSMAGANSYVLFPVGGKRFALPADAVAELAQPDRLHTFPHTTPLVTGVLVRRGRIVPVFDVAEVLVGPGAPIRKFYLIARRNASEGEWVAIPVTGECELVTAKLKPVPEGADEYVTGTLKVGEQTVEVVNLARIFSAYTEAHRAANNWAEVRQ